MRSDGPASRSPRGRPFRPAARGATLWSTAREDVFSLYGWALGALSRDEETMPKESLSIAEARRIALNAQGFGARPAKKPGGAAILDLVTRLGVLQIDSVNVLCRAHYLPVFSRLGAYARDLVDQAAWAPPRALFEYWGHAASFLPVEMAPLFRWRMERAARGEGIWLGIARFGIERREYIDEVLKAVAKDGPLPAAALESPKRAAGGWWNRSDAKRALEWLFWAGLVTTSHRKHFARLYDLPERVLPPEILARPTPTEDDARRELLRISARALGVATEDDLADYFRIGQRVARALIPSLVEEGSLQPVTVEGWKPPAFVWSGKSPSRAKAKALLAPFDPLIWHRARALRLFDFHYRIGIYTPEHARTHGYYVLPFLLGDRIVAQVDLKAERETKVLAVKSAHVEGEARAAEIAGPLNVELTKMASWLGLDEVTIATRKGKLAGALRAERTRAK